MGVRAPLQGFDSFWAGRTQGVALGYLSVPRWGVGGGLGRGWRIGGQMVMESARERPTPSPGQRPGVSLAANPCVLKERRSEVDEAPSAVRCDICGVPSERGPGGPWPNPGRGPGLVCEAPSGQRCRPLGGHWRWAKHKPSVPDSLPRCN